MVLYNPYGDPLTGKTSMQPGQPPQPRRQVLMSPEAAQRRVAMGEHLIAQNSNAEPVRTWLQGLGKLGQTAAGAYQRRKGERALDEHKRQKEDQAKQMMDAYFSGDMQSALKQAGGMFDPEGAANFVVSQASKGPSDNWVILGEAPNGGLIMTNTANNDMKMVPGSAPGKPIAVLGPDGKPRYVNPNDAVGKTPYMRGGQSITVGPDGTVNITEGDLAMGAANLQNISGKNRSMAEEKLINAQTNKANLEMVMDAYDERFLTLGGKAKAWAINANEKGWDLGLAPDPSADELDFAGDMAVFHARAWQFGNQYIKDITGAQMSQAEADRIMLAVPNAGKGNWFDGMAPTQFKRVLEDTMHQAELAEARYKFLIMHGFMTPEQIVQHNSGRNNGPVGGISLNQMDQIMKDEWKVQYTEGVDAGLSPDDAASLATEYMKGNYGASPRIKRPETMPPPLPEE